MSLSKKSVFINKWHVEITAFTWPRIRNWCSASTTTALSRRMHCWETAGIEPHLNYISSLLAESLLQSQTAGIEPHFNQISTLQIPKNLLKSQTLTAWTCIPCWRRTVVVAKTKSLPLILPARITRTGTGTNTNQIQMKTPIQIKTKSEIQTQTKILVLMTQTGTKTKAKRITNKHENTNTNVDTKYKWKWVFSSQFWHRWDP